MGLFDKFKKILSGKTSVEDKKELNAYDAGLKKTRNEFVSKLNLLTLKHNKIDDSYYEELEDILIMADIGVNTVMMLIDKLKTRVKKENITSLEDLKEIIVDEMFIIYVNNEVIVNKINLSETGPSVVLFVGVNGVGKTTTIGKLAHKFKSEGKKVLLIAGDTFRAGAVEQLVEWSKKTNTDIVYNLYEK